MPFYVYIVTRNDLPRNHLTVQVAHAAIAATILWGFLSPIHPHLVVLAVENEEELKREYDRLRSQGIPVSPYFEDDMDNAMTAIATAPLHGQARKAFRKLNLLK